MIESIIAFLIEIGILRADFKHVNKVSMQEQKDGKKRTFSKYFFQPSVIALLAFILLIIPISMLLSSSIDERRMQASTKEMHRINETLKEWNNVYKLYPSELQEITRQKPLRKEWLKDQWEQPYFYKTIQEQQGFILRSSGPDKVFGNSDDLEIKSF